jgi:hypothetical protein
MRIRSVAIALFICFALAQSAVATQIGTDIIVPAGARTTGRNNSQWIMTMYILNPGLTTAATNVDWLVRNRDNSNPARQTYSIAPGQTLVLEDLILSEFGLNKSEGAFRVTSNRAVMVTAVSLNVAGGKEYATIAEGVPVTLAIQEGETTHVIGLKHNDDYRTNITLVDATGLGSTATVTLVDVLNTVVASKTYDLDPYEPVHETIAELGSVPSFADGTLLVTVDDGAVITNASRVNGNVNEGTGDPVTLSSWWPETGGDSSLAGKYFGILETDRFRGITMTINDNEEVLYLEFETDHPSSGCTFYFPGGTDESSGFGFDPPIALESFLDPGGVSFLNSYDDLGIGQVSWVVALEEMAPGYYYTGTVTGVGSNLSGDYSGCNGAFSVGAVTIGKNPNP